MSDWTDDELITLVKGVADHHISVAEAVERLLYGQGEPAPPVSHDRDRIDIAGIAKRLPPRGWDKPKQMGEDAWFILGNGCAIIVSFDSISDPEVTWLHASISYQEPNRMPSYSDLTMLHAAVFDGGHAYQCFVPPDEHVNITRNVLHLWGRADGKAALPNFARFGTI